MLKRLSKKVLLVFSVLTTSVLGFLFANTNSNNDTNLSVLKDPIFSIEKAHADGAGGDCCCPSDWPAATYPDLATVYISNPEIY